MRVFLNVMKRKGFKALFFAVDDIWLYDYHKRRYDGILKDVFRTIRFVEEKQWEIVGLEEVKDEVENSIQEVPEYNRYSNPTYLDIERKNNLFIDSTMDFFVFFVPLTLVSVFLFNRIFYLLFNYEISKYLRPYSFLLIIFELLIQNNVEFFTFLSFRSMEISFSLNFTSKC